MLLSLLSGHVSSAACIAVVVVNLLFFVTFGSSLAWFGRSGNKIGQGSGLPDLDTSKAQDNPLPGYPS